MHVHLIFRQRVNNRSIVQVFHIFYYSLALINRIVLYQLHLNTEIQD